MIDKDKIKKINELMVQRYNDKFQKFGMAPESLGWGSRDDQITRFSTAVDSVDFSNKSVLDIGCGLSDFYKFLKHKEIPIRAYKGIDINPNFININKNNFPDNKYQVKDIILEPLEKDSAEIAVMFGLINFNFKDYDNFEYAKEFIERAFSSVKEYLIVDMLSRRRNLTWPKENFVFYYSPEKMLKFCLGLTNDIILRHDYKSIPQKEFMLILKKNE